jgi:hypothetical protein
MRLVELGTWCVNRCRTYFKHHYLWYKSTVESRPKKIQQSVTSVLVLLYKVSNSSFINKINGSFIHNGWSSLTKFLWNIGYTLMILKSMACVTHNYHDQLQKMHLLHLLRVSQMCLMQEFSTVFVADSISSTWIINEI